MGPARKHLVRTLQVVWGFPQVMVGLVVTLVCVLASWLSGTPAGGVWEYRSAWVREWSLPAGLSLGLFVFVPRNASSRLLVHEYGHCVQSLILGPLYLAAVVVPSLLWAGVPAFAKWRERRGVSYYAVYPENWANRLGERVCGEPAMR